MFGDDLVAADHIDADAEGGRYNSKGLRPLEHPLGGLSMADND